MLSTRKGHNRGNPNHPPKGAVTKVSPVRDLTALSKLKARLYPHPRNYCLLIFGINTNLRASDLLQVRVGQVRYCEVGDTFQLREKKTQKLRAITMNPAVYEAVQRLLETIPKATDDDALFQSKQGKGPLTVSSFSYMVKNWCREIGLTGNHASHSLRKTFGFVHRKIHQTDIPTLMVMFNHSSQKETLDYLGIQQDDVQSAYMKVV